jgi:hypothetical protein
MFSCLLSNCVSTLCCSHYAEDRKCGRCVISLDGNILGVKHHKSGGKFKIAEDSKGGIYVNRIVDAGDILQVEK